MKKIYASLFFVFITSCAHVEFVLNEKSVENILKNKTVLILDDTSKEGFNNELLFYFGNTNSSAEFILKTVFSEQKEYRLVKKNQVAEKIDYEIKVDYWLYFRDLNCEIYNKRIISKFSFTPKSFGYNFGTDRSLEKLYKEAFRQNIKDFISATPKTNLSNCL